MPNRTTLYLLLLLLPLQSMATDSPFGFGASYVGEGMTVLRGGLKRGSSYEGMANLSMSFSTERAGWWKGGSFLVTGANTHGGTPSSELIGDFQAASNIEAGDLTYLHECWFRQEINAWTFLVGLQDLNSEFVYTESGNAFLNSSFGTHSTIASNVPTPIFPLTSLGLQVHYALNPSTKLKLAVFDGMPEDMDYNPHNISWHLNSNDGYLAFAQVEWLNRRKPSHPGTYKLGVYYHNHSPYGKGADLSVPNDGLYLCVDQTLVKRSNARSLDGFLQASLSPASKNQNNAYLGGGLLFRGPFADRAGDLVGLGFAHAALQQTEKGGETSLELHYTYRLCEQVFVQPDVQYILHTAGSSHDALVAFLRFGVEF